MNQQIFEDFPDNARVWLYQTDRALINDEIATVDRELESFVRDWAAHGNQLWANAKVVNPFFIAVAVNDKLTPPSGCSIDASVKKLQELGRSLSVDFFTRLKVTVEGTDEKPIQIAFDELSAAASRNPQLKVYDPLISQLGELRGDWLRPLGASNLSQVVG
ncbi:MAG: hypothetical protein ACQERC_12240 [Bacteroidota bacterium]